MTTIAKTTTKSKIEASRAGRHWKLSEPNGGGQL